MLTGSGNGNGNGNGDTNGSCGSSLLVTVVVVVEAGVVMRRASDIDWRPTACRHCLLLPIGLGSGLFSFVSSKVKTYRFEKPSLGEV